MDIVEKINELRKQKGWSENRLSIESNIPQSTISSWFRKNVQPSITSLQAICSACGITLSQFFAQEHDCCQLTSLQKEFLYKFASLSSNQQQAIICVMLSMSKHQE